MAKIKEGGWFGSRSYNHLDYPLGFSAAQKLVIDPAKVAKRQFLPLIGYTEERRRYRTDNSDRTIRRKLRPIKVSVKKREIRYASHGDAAVYQYYAWRISEPYDVFLKAAGLDDCVIGYRSGKGSNVDMAAEAFSEISVRGDVTALCFDIEDFFPSIRHEDLKRGLLTLIESPQLPSDWYQVFRSIAKYSWIEIEELARIEGFNPKEPPFPLVRVRTHSQPEGDGSGERHTG
jgi:RNA-directed DNA polymerase